MTYGEWLQEIATAAGLHDHVGVRALPYGQTPQIGAPVANSYDWYEAEYGTGERIELDGACALTINAAKLADNYDGRFIVLIAGCSSRSGDDRGEVIISEPRVLAIFDREAQ